MNGFDGWSRRKFSVQVLKAGCFAAVLGQAPYSAAAVEVRPVTPETSEVFNVRIFGATNDGSAVSTQAIQKAVDACAKAGGGAVHFPPGEYLFGHDLLKKRC